MSAPSAPTRARICDSERRTSRIADSIRLFPLDGGRRLRAYVIDHAVDSGDLVYNSAAHPLEQVISEPCPVRRHGVVASHRPQYDRMRVGSAVTHYADAADVGGKRGERLPC